MSTLKIVLHVEKTLKTSIHKSLSISQKLPRKIRGALRDLVPFVQLKKREKTPMEEC